MPYIAMSGSYSGYWGSGDTDSEAISNFRSHGGKSPYILAEISKEYEKPYVDNMGGVCAYPINDEARESHPKMIIGLWKVHRNGRRTAIEQ